VKVRLKILPDKPRGSAWRSSARGVNCSVKSGKRTSDAMTRKLKLDPDTCYMLGMYSCSMRSPISITTTNDEVVKKFAGIALKLGVEPNKMRIESGKEGLIKAFFYHSKLEKMFRSTLERRSIVFSHKNARALSYIAGIFDSNGGKDRFGLYIKGLDPANAVIMENLGFHVWESGGRYYILNAKVFITLIAGYSVMLSYEQHSSAR